MTAFAPTPDITFVKCPVHGELVAVNVPWRELLGRCSGCASEAARAITELDEAVLGHRALNRTAPQRKKG